MPPKRNPRSRYRSSLADSTRPGGPTTMDVLLQWITTPGNVKRWRTEMHSPLVREVVELMRDEGLAHRQAPFVRYKLDAIEKQYITAKQWLLETGMHDAYMRGKASKEVKAHVENVCPQFKRLDPPFRGVPLSHKRKTELIELDGDSVEDEEALQGERGEHGEREEAREEEQSAGREAFGDVAEKNGNSLNQVTNPLSKKKAVTWTKPQKRITFRDRLFSSTTATGAEETASLPAGLQKRSNASEEGLPSLTATAARKEKALTPAEPTKKTLDRSLPLTGNGSGKEKSVTSDEEETMKKTKSKTQILSTAVEIAMPRTALKARTSTPAPAKERRGRSSKVTAAVRSTMNLARKTALSAMKEAPLKSTVTRKRKISEEEPSTAKQTQTQKQDETSEDLMVIEREALLGRIEDEQTQRHEVYKLERSKLECELESRQVQLLFEKAAARKKLDQLGVPQDEIDRILPL